MQTTEYSIWDFKKVTIGSEITIYHNDFLIFVNISFNSRTFETGTNWIQIQELSIDENLKPSTTNVSLSNNVNLEFSLNPNGLLQYHNKSNNQITYAPKVTFCYPKKSALP